MIEILKQSRRFVFEHRLHCALHLELRRVKGEEAVESSQSLASLEGLDFLGLEVDFSQGLLHEPVDKFDAEATHYSADHFGVGCG